MGDMTISVMAHVEYIEDVRIRCHDLKLWGNICLSFDTLTSATYINVFMTDDQLRQMAEVINAYLEPVSEAVA
jgi:hypothetical protein